MSRCIGRMQGMAGVKRSGTVAGIDEIVDVEVLDCIMSLNCRIGFLLKSTKANSQKLNFLEEKGFFYFWKGKLILKQEILTDQQQYKNRNYSIQK